MSRTTKGSGLGLSIVKQIFLLHGARYGVESEINKGSNFWFELKKDNPSSQPQPQGKNRRKAGEKTMRLSSAVKNLRGQAASAKCTAEERVSSEGSVPPVSESPEMQEQDNAAVTKAWQSAAQHGE